MTGRQKAVAGVVGLLVVAAVAVVAVAWAAGVRTFVMDTPSMGRAVPVGSLVVTTPAQVSELTAGDVVTTAGGSTTRTHRVVETGDGLRTRGDLNGGVDPEPLQDARLVGRVAFDLPALGWVVRAVPVILLVWLVFYLVTRRLSDSRDRSRYRLLGAFCGLALAVALIRPLLGVELLSMRVDGAHSATAHTVSTGLLPVRVDAEGAGADGEADGAGGTAAGERMFPTGDDAHTEATASRDGEFRFQPRPALSWPWWLGLVATGLSPFLLFWLHHRWITRGLAEADEPDGPRHAAAPAGAAAGREAAAALASEEPDGGFR